jgi:hypothetical protein
MKYMILAILFCSFSFMCMASFQVFSDTISFQKESIEDYNLRIKNQGFGNDEINSSNENSYKFNSLTRSTLILLGVVFLVLLIFILSFQKEGPSKWPSWDDFFL